MVATIDFVRASFGRAMTEKNFIDRFYQLFMRSHPQISERFKDTNMEQQRELLSQALSMVLLFSQGNPIATSVINRIRESHDHNHLNIPPELYDYWEESLIAALAECDPQFSPTLARQWHETLKVSIDHIKAGY